MRRAMEMLVVILMMVLAGCRMAPKVPLPTPEGGVKPQTPVAVATTRLSTRTTAPPVTRDPAPTSSLEPEPEPTAVPPSLQPSATRGALTATPAPIPEITLTILYDNNPGEGGLQTDWGFACLVEGLAETILFDTGGDGALLLRNMDALGVSPGEIDVVVLSHAHTDHTGGLAALLAAAPNVRVYLLATFPADVKRCVREANAELFEVEGALAICPGAWVTGSVGAAIPEQALVLQGPAGLVVITGCAHPGVAELVHAAQRRVTIREESGVPQWSTAPIDLVLGGFHLGNASATHIDDLVVSLRDLGVRRVAPCHCSGDRARRLFEAAYGSDYIPVGVGTRLTLE